MTKTSKVLQSIPDIKYLPLSIESVKFGLKEVRAWLTVIQSWTKIGDPTYEEARDVGGGQFSPQQIVTKLMTIATETLAEELGSRKIEYPFLGSLIGSAWNNTIVS